MTSSRLVLTALVVLTTVLHHCNGDHGCEPKKIKEIKHSLKRPASAYTNAVQNEFRITKVFTERFKQIPNFKTVVSEYVEPGFSYWKKVMKPKVPTVGTLRVTRTCISKWIYWLEENNVKQMYCKHQCTPEAKCQQYVVPREYMDDCRNKTGHVKNIIRDGGPGVNNTDFLVFVDYTQTGCSSSTIAFAGSCQKNAETDRPEVAYINYCPDNVQFIPRQKASLNKTTIHELGHALGFISSLFAYMRDENGKPRTPRTGTANTPNLGEIGDILLPAKNTLDTRDKAWLSASGSQYKTVYVLKTENLLEAARKHFGCHNLTGVDLENNEDQSFIGSHWEKSLFMDEVMMATEGKGYVSKLTLAFMKDTGWYDVDMSAAEELPWGYNKGCEFAKWNCAAYMKLQYLNGRSTEPWCMKVQYDCRPNCAYCDLRKRKTTLPPDFAYFKRITGVAPNETNLYAGTDKYTDYCPYFKPCHP